MSRRYEEIEAVTADMETLYNLSAGVKGQNDRTKESLATLIIRNLMRPNMAAVNERLLQLEDALEIISDLALQIVDQITITKAALAEIVTSCPEPVTPPSGTEIRIYEEGDCIPMENEV